MTTLPAAEVDVVYGLFSGGHDSLCSTHLASQDERFAGVIHMNTGIGIEETREFVRTVCADQGWPLHETHPEEGKYERMVLERGGFPGGPSSHNSMLFYLKQQPMARWLKANTKGRVGLVTGIRKHESLRRMGAGISVPVREQGRKVWISPILEWTKIDCNRYMEERGLPRSPVVDLIHRSGECLCLCGALARSEEILDIAAYFPETALKINALERECERRGIVASTWAGREPLVEGQMQMFSKADLFPLCTTCEANA
jgi:3'-phosphoadenosine 5'-phosphosulfate sulfotransferase (PAPS reductase)/FAD synthetase